MARFLRGQSGNPGGRPKGYAAAQKLAREHAAHAVFALARLCCDMRAPAKLQLEAARELLNRGFGRFPIQEGSGSTGGGTGRFPGLRSKVQDLIFELDAEHARYRRILTLELDQLELEEGSTTPIAPDTGRALWSKPPTF